MELLIPRVPGPPLDLGFGPSAAHREFSISIKDFDEPEVYRGKSRLKLDIGSGVGRRDRDYITVDLCTAADIHAPMWDIPVDDGSVAFIWSSHALEHVAMGDVHRTLKEWFRILQPGGRIILQVPNFDYVAKYWLTGPERQWAEMIVFGNQAHPGEFHKCAFTTQTVRGDLEAAGFVVDRVEMRWSHSQETLQAVARKPKS